jgi:hypothetical protein
VLKTLIKPFKNNLAGGIITTVKGGITVAVIAYFIVYFIVNTNHEYVTDRENKIAFSMYDAISENRQLNPAMQEHYKKDIDKTKWYIKSYEIRYRKLNFEDGLNSLETLAVSTDGASVGTIDFKKGDIVRVEIVSTGQTPLTSMYRILGTGSTAKVIGYAEGSVE